MGPEEARDGHAHGGGSGGGALVETTTMWKGFKLTWTYKDGEHHGYELTCYNPEHRAALKCCRTQVFKANNHEYALRCLKHWALMSETCASRSDHMALPRRLPVASLPSTEELDSRLAPSFLQEGTGSAPKRRRAQ